MIQQAPALDHTAHYALRGIIAADVPDSAYLESRTRVQRLLSIQLLTACSAWNPNVATDSAVLLDPAALITTEEDTEAGVELTVHCCASHAVSIEASCEVE